MVYVYQYEYFTLCIGFLANHRLLKASTEKLVPLLIFNFFNSFLLHVIDPWIVLYFSHNSKVIFTNVILLESTINMRHSTHRTIYLCIIGKVHSHVCTDYFLKVVTNTNLYNEEMKENICYANILCDVIKQISSLSSSTN